MVVSLLCNGLALAGEPAPAAEVVPGAPGPRVCILIAYEKSEPATLEVGSWVRAGGGWRSRSGDGVWSFAAGLDGTFQLDRGREYDMRIGPWLGVQTPLDGVRGEGGLALTFGNVRAFGAAGGLRVGAGVASNGDAHGVAMLWWGLRVVAARRLEYGACTAPPPAAGVAMASGAHLVAAVRRSFDGPAGWETVFGVEIAAAWLLPPYSCRRLRGR